MKIVTWNINSIRLRLNLLQKLTNEFQPDIISLQETKVHDDSFPFLAIKEMGYNYLFYSGQKSYNGVAILSRIPMKDNFSIEFYNNDKRHISVKIKDIELHNFYVPSGGDIPDVNLNLKFKHKLEYINLMEEWIISNCTKNDKMILMGDFNISPHEHDVWSSRQLRNEVSHTDIERSMLIKLQNSLDFVDTARHFVPLSEKFYTWWSYRNINWQKSNRGRRLDHIWVSSNLKDKLLSMQAISIARDWLLPSDHVPYCIDIDI